ncbi:RluA family pseudouridine synthase [Sporolactobacillus shoreicorticis]|uniref:Pseudouridine synthase n=1 Tax=Sporolactobacillus shoreicorticis TaxID=1923877 RepID=A0ABW5S528_9BACL|nr:RluA family pseudouridine synthase [Sporolactobacillus shoreicorticis]MCO7126200.1 RluA family pseudouridine synthase [Sporolactobacillus shoreicorticis]
MEKQCYTIVKTISSAEQGMVMRDYLKKEIKVSRRALSAIKYKGGKLLVDGRERSVRHVLQRGEQLTIVFPPETPSEFLSDESMQLDIVYEDDVVLIVNKPAGIPVIPSHQYPSGTLANGLLRYFKDENLASTVHIINRLDRNTSGLMLVAKHRFSHERFFKMQKKKEIHRRYLAFVEGIMQQDQGVIDAPIGRRDGSAIERMVDWQNGRRSITHYKVLERFNDWTLVAVQLQTGRTHQIRVHFASIGHPLLGDDLYGGSLERLDRQALHSFEVSFIHPFTGELIHLHKQCPDDMLTLLAKPINLEMI